MAGIPDGYVTVPERIATFKELYPDGCFQPAYPERPWEVITVPNADGEPVTFIAYAAAAYRTADDPRPGIGVAWERVPGLTNFTRNSELQNAETSAWGRAIIAVLAADAKTQGIASAHEVAARHAENTGRASTGGTGRYCSVCSTEFTAADRPEKDGEGGFKHKGSCPVGPGTERPVQPALVEA